MKVAMEVKIEKGIAVPVKKTYADWKLLGLQMEVGDSFELKGDDKTERRRIQSIGMISLRSLSPERRFLSRATSETTVRFWRYE